MIIQPNMFNLSTEQIADFNEAFSMFDKNRMMTEKKDKTMRIMRAYFMIETE